MPSLTKVKREPLRITVNGEEYKLPTLKLSGLRRIQFWLDKLPSPIDRAISYASKLPDELKAATIAKAAAEMEDWPPQLGHPAAMKHIETLAGLDLIAQLMVRQGQPGLDDAKVAAVAGDLDLEDMNGMLAHALGLETEGDDPKPEA